MHLGVAVHAAAALEHVDDVFTARVANDMMIDNIEAEYTDTNKTPSQRLRGVLWHCFNKEPEGYKTFPAYYENKLETLINHFKSKLD